MKTLILGLCLLLLTIQAEACSCSGYPFIKSASFDNLVALAKIKRHLYIKTKYSPTLTKISAIPLAMEVEIINVFKGKKEKKSIVVSSRGACDQPILSFKVGLEYIIILEKGENERDGLIPNPNWYHISMCGTNYLAVEKVNKAKYAVGEIDSEIGRMNLWELKRKVIKQKNNKG